MYKKPLCDCGVELVIRQETIYEEETEIACNGEKYKKSKTLWAGDYNNDPRLHCPACAKEYEFNLDEKQRIIRGDLIE